MDTASKVVEECCDLEERKSNLIVFNVPKPECIEFSERKARDREIFDALVEDIGAGPVDIINVDVIDVVHWMLNLQISFIF